MAVNGWKLLEMAGISGWDDNDDDYDTDNDENHETNGMALLQI